MWSPSQGDGGQQTPAGHPGPGLGPGGKGGGGGGPGPGNQGLVHWMSVMAEHMNSGGNPHHDGVHYMWNGAVEVSTCSSPLQQRAAPRSEKTSSPSVRLPQRRSFRLDDAIDKSPPFPWASRAGEVFAATRQALHTDKAPVCR